MSVSRSECVWKTVSGSKEGRQTFSQNTMRMEIRKEDKVAMLGISGRLQPQYNFLYKIGIERIIAG